jgi:hypothetical protein
MKASKQEAYPLTWPEDQVRTRIQDRKIMTAWKKGTREYRELLIRELERMGVSSLVLSTNVPLNLRGDLTVGIEPRDPGVAVYFTRKVKEDYSWQDILGIHDPAPSVEQIESAYKRLAVKYHPDVGGDKEMFVTVLEAKEKAVAWVKMQESKEHNYVIACDAFKEVRLNICAIRLTIAALRQIDRCGASSLLERAWKGFAALPAAEEGHGSAAS